MKFKIIILLLFLFSKINTINSQTITLKNPDCKVYNQSAELVDNTETSNNIIKIFFKRKNDIRSAYKISIYNEKSKSKTDIRIEYIITSRFMEIERAIYDSNIGNISMFYNVNRKITIVIHYADGFNELYSKK